MPEEPKHQRRSLLQELFQDLSMRRRVQLLVLQVLEKTRTLLLRHWKHLNGDGGSTKNGRERKKETSRRRTVLADLAVAFASVVAAAQGSAGASKKRALTNKKNTTNIILEAFPYLVRRVSPFHHFTI